MPILWSGVVRNDVLLAEARSVGGADEAAVSSLAQRIAKRKGRMDELSELLTRTHIGLSQLESRLATVPQILSRGNVSADIHRLTAEEEAPVKEEAPAAADAVPPLVTTTTTKVEERVTTTTTTTAAAAPVPHLGAGLRNLIAGAATQGYEGHLGSLHHPGHRGHRRHAGDLSDRDHHDRLPGDSRNTYGAPRHPVDSRSTSGGAHDPSRRTNSHGSDISCRETCGRDAISRSTSGGGTSGVEVSRRRTHATPQVIRRSSIYATTGGGVRRATAQPSDPGGAIDVSRRRAAAQPPSVYV